MEKEAYKLLAEGKISEALNILESLYKTNTLSKESLFNLALCYYKLENYEESLRILDEIKEENQKVLFLKGVVLRRAGKLEEAKRIFERLGFKDLQEAIPEPIKKVSIILEEQETEESVETDTMETPAADDPYIEIEVNGYMKVEKGYFYCYLTLKGEITETEEYIETHGKGKVWITKSRVKGEIEKYIGPMLFEDDKFKLDLKKDEVLFVKAINV